MYRHNNEPAKNKEHERKEQLISPRGHLDAVKVKQCDATREESRANGKRDPGKSPLKRKSSVEHTEERDYQVI